MTTHAHTAIDEALDARGAELRTLLQQAPDDFQQWFRATAEQSHDEVRRALAGADIHPRAPELAHAHSMLTGAEKLTVDPSLTPHVGADGAIYGTAKYEQLDPGWAEVALQIAKTHGDLAGFQNSPVATKISDQVTLGILGDWGTGYWEPDAPPQRVAQQLLDRSPDITVHLGDEYYAGTTPEEERFGQLFPVGPDGAYALNSNHSMYSGAFGYFEQVLPSQRFGLQQDTSFFALYNDDWLVFGLDSAYHASLKDMYLSGAIATTQQGWMARTTASLPGRKTIVMTHHDGLGFDGTPNALWNEVAEALDGPPDFWYWGHTHLGVAYEPVAGCRGRCVGHGAIPNGQASAFVDNPAVDWYESRLAGDPRVPVRCFNGGLTLQLDGSTLTETFFAEDGSEPYSKTW